jgi:probable HAF family extracellular repeat protein
MPVTIYSTLDDPLATDGTDAFGINAAGQIVGQYQSASGTHGFLYSGGTYTTLDDPSAINGTTKAFGINNMGQVVGWYRDNAGSQGQNQLRLLARPITG